MIKRSTTPVSATFRMRGSLLAIAILMAAAAPTAFFSTYTSARDFNAEIRAVQNQINQYNAEAGRLAQEANTLQNEVSRLENEKITIQAQIDLSQAKHDKLVADIKENEKQIAKNQDALGTIIADMHVDNDISPLLMLASSKTITDYVDKQNKRSTVRDTLRTTIGEIKRLKAELEKQEVEVKRVIAEQTDQRNALAATQAEQQNLLNETRGQEAAYQNLSKEAEAKRQRLTEEHRLSMIPRNPGGSGVVSGGGQLGSYASWVGGDCYVSNDLMSRGGKYGTGQDPLGYACNQCTSYAAWKMMQVTGYGPSWWGHANMWPAKAASLGYQVTSVPRARALGVMSGGPYGHVVYIENYNAAAGTVDISQYNEWNAGGPGWGNYSTKSGVPASAYDRYIYL